jgi:WD40 repeat protein
LFTANGDRLISASADKTVQVWNVVDGMAKLKLDAAAPAECLALTKDGARVLAGCTDKVVRAWTLADGKPAGTPVTTPAEVRGVGVSPDGTRVVAAGADGKARVYGPYGQLQEFFAHDGPAVAAAFLPDGKRLVTASADKTARAWTPAFVWQGSRPGPVRQALFSPKGDRVVSGGDDKAVSLWDVTDGRPVKILPTGEGAVAGVGVSADGSKVAAACADKSLKVYTTGAEDKPLTVALPAPATAVALSPNGQRVAVALAAPNAGQALVFDAATGKLLQTVAEHAAPVSSLAFAGDNRTLISAAADKAVRLADVAVQSAVDAHAGGVSAVAYLPNGSQAVSGGADKLVRLWDVGSGKVVRTFGPLAEPVSSVTVSRDGSLVAAAGGKVAQVWNADDGKEVATLTHPADVAGVAFSADKLRLATAAADNRARVWELATKQEIQSFAHAGPVTAVAYHGNNTNLVTASADKTVAVHALQWVRSVPAPGKAARALAMTASGSHLLAAGDTGKAVLINTGNGNVERTFEGSGPATAVAVSKPGTLVALGGADAVRLFNLADGKQLGQFPSPGAVTRVAFGPDGKTLAASCTANAVRLWDVTYNPGQPVPPEFGKVIATLAHAGPVSDLAWAPDGLTFWTAGQDKLVRLWKFPSEAPTKNFQHPNLVDAVAFSPDGKTLATGCHDGHVRLFDLAKGAQTRDIKAHAVPMQEAIYCLAWTPDGKQVVSGGLDRTLKLWDASSGNLVREFKAYKEKEFEKGHRDGVFCVAFSPDGKTLASGGSDRSVKLWKVDDGSVTLELTNPAFKPGPLPGAPQAHPGWVYGVRFTPDGKYLVSSGGAPQNRGYLATWSLPDGKLSSGGEIPGGTIFGLALAPDGKSLAAGTAGRLPGQEPNVSYVLRVPPGAK